MARKKRITPRMKDGLTNKRAAFWRGDTAEVVLQKRIENRPRRRAHGSALAADDYGRELRRLERNLKRRKTAAARVRIAAKIKELRRAS